MTTGSSGSLERDGAAALDHMEKALELLDRLDLAVEAAAHLDLAIHRLRDALEGGPDRSGLRPPSA